MNQTCLNLLNRSAKSWCYCHKKYTLNCDCTYTCKWLCSQRWSSSLTLALWKVTENSYIIIFAILTLFTGLGWSEFLVWAFCWLLLWDGLSEAKGFLRPSWLGNPPLGGVGADWVLGWLFVLGVDGVEFEGSILLFLVGMGEFEGVFFCWNLCSWWTKQ